MSPKTFHFFTLVTKEDQYSAMCASLDAAGFTAENSIFTVLDNRNGNAHEPYSAITKAVQTAQAPYVVFCHQDLIFFTGPDDLLASIQEVESLDPNWAVLGNAGQIPLIQTVAYLDDPGGSFDIGELPARVITLDENFLVIKRESGVGCSPAMSGFHLYATDLVLNAYEKGYSAYVFRYRVWHKSSTLDYSGLHRIAPRFRKVWQKRLRGAVIVTPSAILFFSRVPFLFALGNKVGMQFRFLQRSNLTRTIDYLLRHRRPGWLPMARFQAGDNRGPRLTKPVRVLDFILRGGGPEWSPEKTVEDVEPIDWSVKEPIELGRAEARSIREKELAEHWGWEKTM